MGCNCSTCRSGSSSSCCDTKNLCDVWQALRQLDVDLRTILASVNNAFTASSPVFTRNQFLEELSCPNNGLPVAVCKPAGTGSWSLQNADDTTGVTLAEDDYRKVIIENPSTNSNNATVNAGNAILPGETITIEFPDHATAPALAILAGAAETVRVQVFGWPV